MKTEQKIPEGWCIKKISDLGAIVSGGTPDTNNQDYWNGDILWVTPSEVSVLQNRFISDTERKITSIGLVKSSAKLLPANSLIVCTRATIGDCCINKMPMCTNQGFKNIIVKNNNVDFLYYLITKNKKELIRKACGSTFLEISKKDIDNLKFFIPPLEEQEKIAEILGTWDETIEKLSHLIKQKKSLKKGLMQKLLTSKTRLKGFTQPWQEVKLGKICKFEKGKQLNKLDMINSGMYPVLNGGVSYSGYTNNWNTEKNTITISEGGNSCGFVSYIQERFWCGGHCYVLTSVKEDKLYLFHLLKFNEENLMKLRVGSGLPNIQLSSLSKFKVFISHDITEQKAIADILSTADEEINFLNKKLEALNEQKKGLMQQLLTGQIRVKVD